MNELLKRGTDSASIRETTLWSFHDCIEAAFLAAKQGMLKASSPPADEGLDIPAGLYNSEFESRILVASEDLLSENANKLLYSLALLGEARMLLVQA